MRWSILVVVTVAGVAAAAPAALQGQQQTSAQVTFTLPAVLHLNVAEPDAAVEGRVASERAVVVTANVRWELVAYCSDGARVRGVDGRLTSGPSGVVVARGGRGRLRLNIEEVPGEAGGSVRYELRAR